MMLSYGVLLAAATATLVSAQRYSIAEAPQPVSPSYTWLFDYPLPIPKVAVPLISTVVNGTPVEFFNSTIESFEQQIYPNLGPTTLVGYNGSSPGPTHWITRGTNTVERYVNLNNLSAAVHLHGSISRAPWDGWADDEILPGQFKDYFHPNTQTARTLWYHDHANGHTSVDAYFGQQAIHAIVDPAEESLGLPSGDYDIPLMLIDKVYLANGSLYSPATERVNFWGDIIHVNGQPWPFLAVEPRKYRFRIINTALSRPFELSLLNDVTGASVSFDIIGSDCGLFGAPQPSSSFYIAMGERYEIVIDFSLYQNTNLTMKNNLTAFYIPSFANTDKIMRFVVGGTVTNTTNNQVPPVLSTVVYDEPASRSEVDHVFGFQHNQENWTINGVVFDDINARVLARPPQGTVETWEMRYESGPGFHPVHIHLVNFKLVSRTGGRGALLPYETAGVKDVALMAPGEILTLTAIYGPWNGLYQFHCHNLIHEDHQMMDAYNVTALAILADLGYSDVLAFDNPMDPRYVARFPTAEYFSLAYVLNTLLPTLVGSAAYSKQQEIQAVMSSYYLTHPYGEPATSTVAASVMSQVVYGAVVTATGAYRTMSWVEEDRVTAGASVFAQSTSTAAAVPTFYKAAAVAANTVAVAATSSPIANIVTQIADGQVQASAAVGGPVANVASTQPSVAWTAPSVAWTAPSVAWTTAVSVPAAVVSAIAGAPSRPSSAGPPSFGPPSSGPPSSGPPSFGPPSSGASSGWSQFGSGTQGSSSGQGSWTSGSGGDWGRHGKEKLRRGVEVAEAWEEHL